MAMVTMHHSAGLCHQGALQQKHKLTRFGLSSRVSRVSARHVVPVTAEAAALLQQLEAQPSAVITGCSTGIGRETSLLLASKGWRVFAGARAAADCDKLALLHTNITPLLLDVTSDASIAAAQQQVQRELGNGGLSVLINNAGRGLVAPAEHVPLDKWKAVLDVNLIAPLAMCQAFLPLLRQASPDKGRIINISSVAGHLSMPFWSAYNVSKAGLDILTDCLRYELQPQGIRVVLVKPGPVITPIWDTSTEASDAVLSSMPPEAHKHYGPALVKMRQAINKTVETAVPVGDVAELLYQAATVPHPKATYFIGKNTRLIYWMKRLVPDATWQHWLAKSFATD